MAAPVPPVTYEELAQIEDEFEEVDREIMRKQYEMSKTLYTKRAEAVSKIPNFWPLVLEQAPLEIDQFIQPSDSRIINESLVSISVTRPELDASGAAGNPKSLKISFAFKPNDDFANTLLEKEFTYRRSADGWAGLVSEPVKIDWKKGKDLSEGLTDGACALWEARKKLGDMRAKGLPEYSALKKKVEHLNGAGTSLFTWFGWVSGRRWVSAEESEQAAKERGTSKAGGAAKADGEEAEDGEDDFEANDDSDVEVHEAGEDLAISIAEDLWPNCIKYFIESQEMEEMSEADFEDDDDEDMEEGDDGEPIDIRALVQDKGGKKRLSDVGPPAKKLKK